MSFNVRGSTIVIVNQTLSATPVLAFTPEVGTAVKVKHVRIDAGAAGAFRVGFGSVASPPASIANADTVWAGESDAFGQLMTSPAALKPSTSGQGIYITGAGACSGSIEIEIVKTA